jgi:hypothetical protein
VPQHMLGSEPRLPEDRHRFVHAVLLPKYPYVPNRVPAAAVANTVLSRNPDSVQTLILPICSDSHRL